MGKCLKIINVLTTKLSKLNLNFYVIILVFNVLTTSGQDVKKYVFISVQIFKSATKLLRLAAKFIYYTKRLNFKRLLNCIKFNG